MVKRRNFILNSALTTTGISLLKSNVIASLVGDKGLKDYFEDDFVVGTAMSAHTFFTKRHRNIGTHCEGI